MAAGPETRGRGGHTHDHDHTGGVRGVIRSALMPHGHDAGESVDRALEASADGVGRRIGSAALVADGVHARTDGLTSLGVVAGALGVAAGVPIADPVVGMVITIAILTVLVHAARDVYRRLMDSVDPELVDRLAGVVRTVTGVEEVDVVRLRWIGHELRAEADTTAHHFDEG